MQKTYDERDVLIQTPPDFEKDLETNPWITEEEEKAKEQGALEYTSGIVRVSDSPSMLEDRSKGIKTTSLLYKETLGITQYDQLRSRVGLSEGQSFTDYYTRTNGQVPEGFELDAKLLLAEEKRKNLYSKYETGQIGYATFLYEAYGKDLLKDEGGHDFSSSLYWYQRYKAGDYSDIRNNPVTMEKVLLLAQESFQSEIWWDVSRKITLDDFAFGEEIAENLAVGEALDDVKIRELFKEQFDQYDEFYESQEQMVKLYQAGMLRDFNPIIYDKETGTKAMYYLHTDLKLYAIEGSGAEGALKAYAHYNDDGTLNRISLDSSGAVEVLASTLKGFGSFFSGFVELGGLVAGGVKDLYQGIAGRGWDFDEATENSVAIKAYFNEMNNMLFSNRDFVVDTGFKTSDGDWNTMGILKGVGGAVGTIAAMLATAGLSKLGNAATLAANTASTAAKSAGVKLGVMGTMKNVGLRTTGGLLKTAGSLTSLTNGAPMGARFATTQSVAMIAVKDFLQTATELSVNKDKLGLTEKDIFEETFKMTATNAAISFAFRSVMDQAALHRIAGYTEKAARLRRGAQTFYNKEAGKYYSGFTNLMMSWSKKSPYSFVTTNVAMDIFENLTTAYLQTTTSQTGEAKFNKDTLSSFLSNPQVIAFNLYAGITTARGGFSKLNEGIETGNVIRHTHNMNTYDTKVRGWFKNELTTALKNGDHQKAQAIEAAIKKYETDVKSEKNPIEGISKALINLYDGMKDPNGDAEVKKIIQGVLKDNVRAEQLVEAELAFGLYNGVVEAQNRLAKHVVLNGILSNTLFRKRDAIIAANKALVEGVGIKVRNSNVKWEMNEVVSNMVEANASIIESEAATKLLEQLEVSGVLKSFEKDPKTGKYIMKSALDDLTADELNVLVAAGLTEADLQGGYFIKVPGYGTAAQAGDDYKILMDALQTFMRISEAETDAQGLPRLMYKLNDKGMVFIPSIKGSNMANITLANMGRAIQILYTLRYDAKADNKFVALKLFKALFDSNSASLDTKDIKSTETIDTLMKLYKAGYIKENEALAIIKTLNGEFKKETVGVKDKLKTPMELIPAGELKTYIESYERIQEIQEILNKPANKQTAKDLEQLKRLYTDFTDKADLKTMEKLKANGVIDDAVLKELAEWVKANPKTSRDLLKRLQNVLTSSSYEDSDTAAYVIRYIAQQFGMRQGKSVPTPKMATDYLLTLTTSEPVKILISSQKFTLNGEVKDIWTASRQELIDYFMAEDQTATKATASNRAGITQKLVRSFLANEITDVTSSYGDSEDAFYRYVYSHIDPASTKDIAYIKAQLLGTEHKINLLNELTAYYGAIPLQDRLQHDYEFTQRVLSNTTVKNGNDLIIINIGALEGATMKYVEDRLKNPYVMQQVNDADSDEKKFNAIFGNDHTTKLKKLSQEYIALQQERINYPDGVAIFNMKDPEQTVMADQLLQRLGYAGLVELRNHKKTTIPGVYYKASTDEDAALSFSIPKEALTNILTKLKTSPGYTKVSTTEKDPGIIDHVVAMHDLFGGLTYLRDDTVINPTEIVYNDLSVSSLDQARFELVDYINRIEALEIKEGKLAGLLRKYASMGMNGVGLVMPRNKETHEAEIIVSVIKELHEYVNDDKTKRADTQFDLTKDVADDFNRNSPVWELKVINNVAAPDGTYTYHLFPKSTTNFEKDALAYLSLGKSNLMYLFPLYGVDLDGEITNRGVADFKVQQQTTGETPVTYIRGTELISRYNIQEITSLFFNTDYTLKYNTTIDEKTILKDYFQQKTVADIIKAHDSLDANIKENLYYHMMYNFILSAKALSDQTVGNMIKSPTGLLELAGSYDARILLGREFNLLTKLDREITDADYDAIAQRVKAQLLALPHEHVDSSSRYFQRDIALNNGDTYISGAQGQALYGLNRIGSFTGADVKEFYEMIGQHKLVFTNTDEITSESVERKILSMLVATNSEEEGRLNLFIDMLYDFTPDEAKVFLDLFKGVLKAEDYELLENKFKLIQEESDIYRQEDELPAVGEKLAIPKATERVPSLDMVRGALIKENDRDRKNTNLFKLLNIIENNIRHNRGKTEYKISEIEALALKNQEINMMIALAKKLGIDVLPYINREASLLIKNMEIRDNLGAFVDSTARMSTALQQIDFNGKKISKEAATKLALAIYMDSSGTDFQNEWSKYLFFDLDSGEIVTRGQSGYGDKELNGLTEAMASQFKDIDNKNIVVFELDKNMMSDSTSVGGGRLKYFEFNAATKNQLQTLFVTNYLEQAENNPYFRDDVALLDNDLDKVEYVFARTPSQKTIKDSIIESFVANGVDERMARFWLYNFYDVQSSKAENNARQQILFNTFAVRENLTDNQRAVFNRQMKHMNDLLKYQLTYDGLPEHVKLLLADKVKRQDGTFGEVVRKLLFNDDPDQAKLQYAQVMKDAEDRLKNLEQRLDDIKKAIASNNADALISLIEETIKDSQEYYDIYGDYIAKGWDKNVTAVMDHMDEIRKIHKENRALIKEAQRDLTAEYNKLSDDIETQLRLSIAYSRQKFKDVDSEEFKTEMFKELTRNYIFGSKEAGAVSLALNGTDIDYLLNFRTNDIPVEIELPNNKRVKIKDLKNKNIISVDVENFFNNTQDDSPIFQVGITYRDAQGNFKTSQQYVPVYKNGKLLDKVEDLRLNYPKFFDEYGKEAGIMKAVNEYIAFVNKPDNLTNPIDLDATIKELVGDETEIYSIGFNSSEHDLPKLLQQKLISEKSPYINNENHIDVLKVSDRVQTTASKTNKKDLQSQIKYYNVIKTDEHGAHFASDDAENTIRLLLKISEVLIPVQKSRQDAIDDITAIGKLVYGDNFNLANDKYKRIVRDLKLDTTRLPEVTKSWIENYRTNFKNTDNLLRNQETINKINYLYLLREQEINYKKGQEFVSTLPPAVRDLVYQMTKPDNRANFETLVAYLAQVKLDGTKTTYRTFDGMREGEGLDLLLGRTYKEGELITERNGVLDKVIYLLRGADLDKNKKESSFDGIAKILSLDPEEIIARISNDPNFSGFVSLDDYRTYASSGAKNDSKFLSVMKNEFTNSSELTNIKTEQAKKSLMNRLENNVGVLRTGMFEDIQDPELRSYMQRAFTTLYNKVRDRDLKNTLNVYNMENSMVEKLLELIKVNPVKQIKKYQLTDMASGISIGDKISIEVNGKTKVVEADGETLYVQKEHFKNLVGVDYEVALKYYDSDEEALYVPVVRHPNDKISLAVMKVVIMSNENSNKGKGIAIANDTLASLLSGDVDGDAIAFFRPNKANNILSKHIMPITRSAHRIWDDIAKDLNKITIKNPTISDDPKIVTHLQKLLLTDTKKDLESLNNGLASYDELRKNAEGNIRKELDRLKLTYTGDDVTDLIKLVWINKGPNQSFFEDETSRRPYYSYSLELYSNKYNINALQRMKESRANLKKHLQFVDQATGHAQKRSLLNGEHATTYEKIFNYAQFGVSADSLTKLKWLFNQASQNSDYSQAVANIKDKIIHGIKTNQFLNASQATNLTKLVAEIQDEGDFLYVMRIIESEVRYSDKAEDIIINAVRLHDEALNDSAEVDPADNYLNALKGLRAFSTKSQSESGAQDANEYSDSFDKLNYIAQLYNEVVGDFKQLPYFQNVQNTEQIEAFILDQFIKNVPGKYDIKETLSKPNEPGFSNYQQRKVLFVKDDPQLGEDFMLRGPGADSLKYAFAQSLRFDNDETIEVVEGETLVQGMRLSTSQYVPEEMVGYKVARKTSNNEIIIYKPLDIDGQAKLAIAGTGINKGTLKAGQPDYSNYEKLGEAFKHIVAISSDKNFSFKKMSEVASDKLTITYYDENFTPLGKNPTNYKYMIVDAPVAVAQHTATWKGLPKVTTIDEITLSTSSRSMEGMGLLGNKFIMYNEDTGGIEFDSRGYAAIEQAIHKTKSPDRVSNNAMPLYKAMLFTKLVNYTEPDKAKAQQLIKDTISLKSFSGPFGTQEIQKLMNSIDDMDKFLDSLSPMERGLFSNDLLKYLFPMEISKLPELKDIPAQRSKSNHFHLLRGLAGAYTPRTILGGIVAEDVSKNAHGQTTLSREDTFLPQLDFINQLITEYNRVMPESKRMHYLDDDSAKRATELQLLNSEESLEGNMGTEFKPIKQEYAIELSKTPNPPKQVDPKTGLVDDITMKINNPTGNFEGIVSRKDDTPNIDLTRKTDNYADSRKISYQETNTFDEITGEARYAQVYRDRYDILLGGLLSGSTDAVGMAGLINPKYSHLNLHPNRQSLEYDERSNDYLVKAQPIKNAGIISATEFKKTMQDNFSSNEYYKQIEERLMKLKEYIAPVESDPSMSRLKPEEDKPITGNLMKTIDRTEAYKQFNYERIDQEIKEAAARGRIRSDKVTGEEEKLFQVYKADALETMGNKIKTVADIEAANIGKHIIGDAASIAREFNYKLHNVAETVNNYGLHEETREYTFVRGKVSEIESIDKLIAVETDTKALAELKSTRDAMVNELRMTEAEAEATMKRFQKIYPEVSDAISDLLGSLRKTASYYAKFGGEVSDDIFLLIKPDIKDNKDNKYKKNTAGHVTRMLLNTDVVTRNGRQLDYTGYNFFEGMSSIIQTVAKQAAITRASIDFQEKGLVDNAKVQEIVQKEFEIYRESLEELGQGTKYTYNNTMAEINNFEAFLQAVEMSLSEGAISFSRITQDVKSNKISIGAAYLKVYDILRSEIDNKGMSREKAMSEYRTSNSPDTKSSAENILTLYELSNDILALLAMKQQKDNRTSGATFLESIYKKLTSYDPNLVLVDKFGRQLDPDVNKFAFLFEGSTEATEKLIRYYMPKNIAGGFESNVAFDALNGDVYFMSKSLSDMLMKNIYVTKPYGTLRKALVKAQRVAVSLIMSSPFKLADRMLKYTGFDLGLLAMADPGVFAKLAQSRRDFSAFAGSKGTVMSDDLKEFIRSEGFDPNHVNFQQLLSGADEYTKNGTFLKGYLDTTNKAFSYQTYFARYAFWLSARDKLRKGKATYGSAYSKKHLINELTAKKDLNGKEIVSKEGVQAAYIMGENLGSPGDFPILSKRLNGYFAFTTFPFALVRWTRGELTSMGTAAKNLFVEGETAGALRHLGVQGMGILGIYLTSNLIYELMAALFGAEDEEKEEWKEEKAIPNLFSSFIQDAPVMDNFASINPLNEVRDMTIQSFEKDKDNQAYYQQDDDEQNKFFDSIGKFMLRNVVSKVNPAVKTAAEIGTGYDLIDNKLINTRDQYSGWENFLRKTIGYITGIAGASAMTKYMKSYEDSDHPFIERIGIGMKRAVDAELGNTKTYKSSIKNYYRANSIIQAYYYADRPTYYGNSNFDTEGYQSVKDEMSKAINGKYKFSDVYAIIQDALEDGVGINEIVSAVRNSSLRYKIERIEDMDAFFNSLTPAEKETIKSALKYEDYLFPWLDEFDDALKERYGAKTDGSYKRLPYINRNYIPYSQSNYQKYMRSNPYYKPYKPWEPDLIQETPYEAFKGKKEWVDWSKK